MAIPSSGSISALQIQAEFGLSSPISLNEYYSGRGFSNTTSFVIPNALVNGASASVTSTIGKTQHTSANNNFGFKHSSLATSSRPTVGQAGISTPNVRSGVDLVGNAGAIPASGTISFDHFRGTSVGTVSSGVAVWGIEYHTSTTASLNISSANWYFYFQGHLGTNNQGNVSWDGMPFSSIVTTAIGSPAAPATTFTFSGTHSANGAASTKVTKTHLSNSTIGNYTQCQFTAASTSYRHSTSNNTWYLTFNI